MQTVLQLALPLLASSGHRPDADDAFWRRLSAAQHMQWCADVGVPLWVPDCPEACDPTLADPSAALAAERTELDKLALRMLGVTCG